VGQPILAAAAFQRACRTSCGVGDFGNNAGRAARPGRALFPESARAATRGTRGIGNSNTSRVARPGRALFPESARAATRGARGIGSSNTSRVARPGRALFPERRLPERAQVSVPVVFFDPAGLLRGQPGKRA